MNMEKVTTHRVVRMLILYEYGGGNDPPINFCTYIKGGSTSGVSYWGGNTYSNPIK